MTLTLWLYLSLRDILFLKSKDICRKASPTKFWSTLIEESAWSSLFRKQGHKGSQHSILYTYTHTSNTLQNIHETSCGTEDSRAAIVYSYEGRYIFLKTHFLKTSFGALQIHEAISIYTNIAKL